MYSLKGGTKSSRRTRRRLATQKRKRKARRRLATQKLKSDTTVKSDTNGVYLEQNAVMLIWINKKVSDTIYNGLPFDVMVKNTKLDSWISYRDTHDKNFKIYFIYDSKMVSASPEAIAEYISPISADIIFLDIRIFLLDWVYEFFIHYFKTLFIAENTHRPDEKSEDEYISEYLNEYLQENLKKNNEVDNGNENNFGGLISDLSVPIELYSRVQNMGLREFINDILFSELTPIYFRVDIVRIMAQLYLGSSHKIDYILTIDIDIIPDENKLLDYMFNNPGSGPDAVPDFVKEILIQPGITMFNGENGMSLLNRNFNDFRFFYKICFVILIMHPIITYLGFIKYPGYFNYLGNPRNINSYSQLVCDSFSQIVYNNYIATEYYFKKLYKWKDDIDFKFAMNDLNWILYNSNKKPYTRYLHGYFQNDEPLTSINPVKKMKIPTGYLVMPISQFDSAYTNPCFKK